MRIRDRFHHNDYPFWSDFVVTRDNPIIQNGFIRVPDDPGLGILALNDDCLLYTSRCV